MSLSRVALSSSRNFRASSDSFIFLLSNSFPSSSCLDSFNNLENNMRMSTAHAHWPLLAATWCAGSRSTPRCRAGGCAAPAASGSASPGPAGRGPIRGDYRGHVTNSPPTTAHLGVVTRLQPPQLLPQTGGLPVHVLQPVADLELSLQGLADSLPANVRSILAKIIFVFEVESWPESIVDIIPVTLHGILCPPDHVGGVPLELLWGKPTLFGYFV